MKKILLMLSAAGFCTLTATAQQRLSLYEEFSGENCPPCAAYNPGLWTLLNAGTNSSKVMLIKYQSPIPTAGPIYNNYPAIADARLSYYGERYAPTGYQNGNEVAGANISTYTQAQIDAANTPAPFNINAVHSWSTNGDSVYATINIAAVAAYAPAGARLKLRTALIESLSYCSPPGTNGETEFHHVVRDMYPNASGIDLPASWTVGQSQSITVGGRVKNWINKSDDNAILVVWIQNDNDKHIPQAGKSVRVALTKDAGFTGCNETKISCAAGAVSSAHTVTLKNTGSTTITSAQINYKLDNAAYQTYSWTGSIAAGSSASIVMPTINNIGIGNHIITDSIISFNGGMDVNTINDKTTVPLTIRNNTSVAFPVTETFENNGTIPAYWLFVDVNANGDNWKMSSRGAGRNSNYAIKFDAYNYAEGETDYAILPTTAMPAGARSLDFWLAYAQYNTQINEKLEVIYSTNCGDSWTSLWSRSGTALATTTPVTSVYTPTAAHYKLKSIDLSSVPANAIIAFKATSAYGNNIYIDDINLRAGIPTGIDNIVTKDLVKLYPNPAGNSATLEFMLTTENQIQVMVYDMTGRMVSQIVNAKLSKGSHSYPINTSSLSSGLYNVKIQTEEGSITERLSVIK
jgi:hypothetical protein